MLIDAVQPLMILCYNNEGDRALKCATAFDEWMETLDHLHKASGQDGSPPLLPNVGDIAAFARPNDLQGQIKLVNLTAAKVRPIHEKMFSDTHNRIVDTITLLRGCKLLNFSFVKKMNIEALEEELDFIRIPMANFIFGALKTELVTYKRVAMESSPD